MKLYHRTTPAIADAIVGGQFRDTAGFWGTATERTGVWLADFPLPWYDFGGTSDMTAVLEVEVEESAIAEYEWVQEGLGYREWLVPADLLNPLPRRRLTDDEVDELE